MILRNKKGENIEFSFINLYDGEKIRFHPVQFQNIEYGLLINEIREENLSIILEGKELEKDYALFYLSGITSKYQPMSIGEIDSIEKWYKYGSLLDYDYKYIRSRVIEICINKTNNYTELENLSQSERDIMINLVAAPIEIIEQISGELFERIVEEWDKNSSSSRSKRWSKAKMYVFRKLSQQDAKSVLVEVTMNGDLVTRYLGGIEGTEEDNGEEGIFDYILAKEGTSFEGNGLKSKNFVPKENGTTIEDVCTGIINILKEGVY